MSTLPESAQASRPEWNGETEWSGEVTRNDETGTVQIPLPPKGEPEGMRWALQHDLSWKLVPDVPDWIDR